MKQFAIVLWSGDFLGASGDETEFCSCAIHFDSQQEAEQVASRFLNSRVVPVKPLSKPDYAHRVGA